MYFQVKHVDNLDDFCQVATPVYNACLWESKIGLSKCLSTKIYKTRKLDNTRLAFTNV